MAVPSSRFTGSSDPTSDHGTDGASTWVQKNERKQQDTPAHKNYASGVETPKSRRSIIDTPCWGGTLYEIWVFAVLKLVVVPGLYYCDAGTC